MQARVWDAATGQPTATLSAPTAHVNGPPAPAQPGPAPRPPRARKRSWCPARARVQVLGVYVQGLQEIAADSGEKIAMLMDQGNDMRAVRRRRASRAGARSTLHDPRSAPQVASTNMNATSSRSHSISIIKKQQQQLDGGGIDEEGLGTGVRHQC